MIKKYSVYAFFVLLILYVSFQGRYLILGPRITIKNPADNSLVDVGVMTVRGVAKNVSELTLDDRRIYTDTKGFFEEKLIAHQGINIIKLVAIDRFGREEEELVRVVAN